MSAPAKDCRLPKAVVPSNYALHLTPDLTTFTFTGIVTVTVNVVGEPVSVVRCHAKELTFSSIVADGDNAASAFDVDTDVDILSITFPSPLAAGPHTITFTYAGTINDNLVGLYRAQYTNAAGEKKYIACTQFEATDARLALPCWDEPAFKATFNVTLTVADPLLALSNMPVTNKTTAGGLSTYTYGTSPIMSTYLLAFVIGEFDKVSDFTVEGTEVNVYTTPGKKEEGLFALDVACETLSFFASYFSTAYPLPKADLVAIPDFAAGAMENWGLITFRETALLVNETKSATAFRQRVAYVVAHELAHQWFGNLVTMQWWSELWLNEGFATWAGWLAVEHAFPDWAVWEQFVATECSRALGTDAMLSSHPIEIPIADPKLIDQVFDALSYQKGASVIRMLEAYIGTEAFKAGMALYLSRHQYSNATTVDLWAALGTASGKPVPEVMSAWTSAPGYPVLTVDAGGCVCQSRFLASGAPKPEEDATTWKIPVLGVNAAGATISTILSEKSPTDSATPLLGSAYFKLNSGQAGFYRVNYTGEQWAALTAAVTTLPAVDRLGLVSDAYALFKASLAPVSVVLSLYAALKSEKSLSVWTQITADIADLTAMLEAHPDFALYQRFLKELYSEIVATVGWEFSPADSHVTKLLRVLALKAASGVEGMTSLVEVAKAKFTSLASDFNSVHPELKDLVMNVAVANGGPEEFEAVKGILSSHSDHAETVNKCLVALGRTRVPDLVTKCLDWAFTSGEVRNQDLFFIIASFSSNRASKQQAWEYVKANFAAINAKFSSSPMLYSRVLTYPLAGFTTTAAADDASAFFAANPCPDASMAIEQAIETIRGRAAAASREQSNISAFLKAWAVSL